MLCKTLEVSRSGYYSWLTRTPGKRALENERLLTNISVIFEQSRGLYGSPRITRELNKQGFQCSVPRVARIMAKNNIRAKTKRKFKVTTNSKHKYPIAPNLVNQEFTSDAPNKVWTSDITYIRTMVGWLYLTVILDLFNRQVIGWSMSHRLNASRTTIPALKHAYQRQRPSGKVIFHSDRGIQYACSEFREFLLDKYHMVQSMSGKGNCYDNAVTESFFHTLKTECVYQQKYISREQAKHSIFEYIEVFYNHKRSHSALGYVSPIEFALIKKAA